MKFFWIFAAVFILTVALIATTTVSAGGSKMGKITVTSKSFKNNKNIPVKYTMVPDNPDAWNVSPQLSFKTKSKKVKSYALLMYDKAPIAKNWVHWCVTGIPINEADLVEGASGDSGGIYGKHMPINSDQFPNSYGYGPDYAGYVYGSSIGGYDGPNPPKGSGVHKYEFWVVGLNVDYALDPRDLDNLEEPHALCTLSSFKKAIEGKVVAEGRLIGKYEVK